MPKKLHPLTKVSGFRFFEHKRMYAEKKKIENKSYYYARISGRISGKTKTKTVAYLGKAPMTKKQIKKKMASIPQAKVDAAQRKLKEELKGGDINKKFLAEKQLEKLTEIKRNFAEKLRKLDKKLIEDMFKDFKTYYIYNTNSIEGNSLTLEETNLLLNEGKTPEGKDLKEIYDHINEREVFDYLLAMKPEIDLDLIIRIHEKLLGNIDSRLGFRQHNVRVFGAAFETSDAKYVYTDMSLLLKWYRRERKRLHPLILAALFHEKFERIHPFYDGNGRTGRMLLNLILLRGGLPPLIVKNRIRKEYYHVLSEGHQAELFGTEVQPYQDIVRFCCRQLLETFRQVFAKWG